MVTVIADSAKYVRSRAMDAYNETISSPSRAAELDRIAANADLLHDFIYEYWHIDDPLMDTDDEIINWTFCDVIDDLSNAVWNVASGFHKAGASSLRNAFELSMVSLAFHVENNVDPSISCYAKTFGAWDGGKIDTPNWSFIKPKINSLPTISHFNAVHACDLVKEAHDFYHELCAFTHSRTFDKNTGAATNSMSLGIGTPTFDVTCFDRFTSLIEATYSWIASAWAVSYPGMLAVHAPKYRPLFTGGRGGDALSFAAQWLHSNPVVIR